MFGSKWKVEGKLKYGCKYILVFVYLYILGVCIF